MSNSNTADGKWCVTVNGRQVTGPLDEKEAKDQANDRRKLIESRNKDGKVKEDASTVKASQILYG